MANLTDAQVDALSSASVQKLAALRGALRQLNSVLVAFSGGVDSALVLKVAVEVLGERAVALTAISPSVAPEEAESARELAKAIGARHVQVNSNELADPRYAANPTNRCYFCKTELYALCEKARVELGLAAVLDGFNADDKKDHRPGHQAAREHEVRSLLAEVGLSKPEIRAWSKKLGLPTWEKPQLACLSSRLPYGTAVTSERLGQIGRSEKAVRDLGFKNFRVRYHGEVARLEVAADELDVALAAPMREQLAAALKAQGFTFVAIDLEPFRSGRLNDSLKAMPQRVALPVLAG